jgi:hypothetical protein
MRLEVLLTSSGYHVMRHTGTPPGAGTPGGYMQSVAGPFKTREQANQAAKDAAAVRES